MVEIHVVKPFTFQHEPKVTKRPDPNDDTKMIEEVAPSVKQQFTVGVYEVEEAVAAHWYVQAHLRGYEEPPKGPGMAEYRAPGTQPAQALDPLQPVQLDTTPRLAPLPPDVIQAVPVR